MLQAVGQELQAARIKELGEEKEAAIAAHAKVYHTAMSQTDAHPITPTNT